jgi:hypothetical protein
VVNIHQLRRPHLDLDLARERLERFAFVGLTERFQDSLFLLAYTFGWRPVLDPPHVSASESRVRREQVAPADLQAVEAFNALDLELYEHGRRLFEVRYERMIGELTARYRPPLDGEDGRTPSAGTLYGLLERHADEHAARRRRVRARLCVDVDRAYANDGWHATERQLDGDHWRWIGPQPSGKLDVLLPLDRDVKIRIHVPRAVSAEQLNSFRLTANRRPIPLAVERDGCGGATFAGRIRRNVLANRPKFTTLTFSVDRTLAPCDVDPASSDRRLLGVAIGRIDARPVVPPEEWQQRWAAAREAARPSLLETPRS